LILNENALENFNEIKKLIAYSTISAANSEKLLAALNQVNIAIILPIKISEFDDITIRRRQ